jgi:hypothetical protein
MKMQIKIKYLLIFLLLFTTVSVASAQDGKSASPPQDVKLLYKGNEVTYQELQDLTPNDSHCAEQPTVSNTFVCFDTLDEALDYLDGFTAKQGGGATTMAVCTGTPYWYLYRQSFWNDFITSLGNSQAISNANQIWSLYKIQCPNSITVYGEPNYGGGTFTYVNTQPTLWWGGRSARVN